MTPLFGGPGRLETHAKPDPAVMKVMEAQLGRPLKVSAASKIGRQRKWKGKEHRSPEPPSSPRLVVICQSTTCRLQVAACRQLRTYRLLISPRYRLYRTFTAPAHVSHIPHTYPQTCLPASSKWADQAALASLSSSSSFWVCLISVLTPF